MSRKRFSLRILFVGMIAGGLLIWLAGMELRRWHLLARLTPHGTIQVDRHVWIDGHSRRVVICSRPRWKGRSSGFVVALVNSRYELLDWFESRSGSGPFDSLMLTESTTNDLILKVKCQHSFWNCDIINRFRLQPESIIHVETEDHSVELSREWADRIRREMLDHQLPEIAPGSEDANSLMPANE